VPDGGRGCIRPPRTSLLGAVLPTPTHSPCANDETLEWLGAIVREIDSIPATVTAAARGVFVAVGDIYVSRRGDVPL
jgi:hypothetical protein